VQFDAAHALPFWDAPEDARPFFMQIVLPFQNNRWADVQKIASHWREVEPNNAEAWFYLGAAAQNQNDSTNALKYFNQALALHPNHPPSLQALAMMAQQQGNATEVNTIRTVLKSVSADALKSLDDALGTLQQCTTC